MKVDAYVLGHALSTAISDIWMSRGQDRAFSLIDNANSGQSRIQIRWVWLDGAGKDKPSLKLDLLTPLSQGEDVVANGKRADGIPVIFTYIPVTVPDGRAGALELSEPLTTLQAYTRSDAQILIAITLALITGGSIFISLAGHRIIGKRLKVLEAYAGKIGSGDLSYHMTLQGRDEIAGLGRVMKTMTQQLDAARRKSLEETEARIEALEQLRHTERLATLGRLSAGLAHEMGTPLNVVSGRAKQIREHDFPHDDVIDCARIIGEQADRMSNIIRQLLDFARGESLNKIEVNVGDLTAQVVEMLEPMAHKQGVILSFERGPKLAKTTLDAPQMQQVLMNLMMNGLQAMPDGGKLSVFTTCRSILAPPDECVPGEYVCVSISDEGPGVSEDMRDSIFEPFFTTKEIGEGTGLGLSIAYGIVKEHKGWIEVSNAPEGGACFTVLLPVGGMPCPGVS